jgi:hypothetical protein
MIIAYRFGDEAVRLLDLEDSSQHDWGWIRGHRERRFRTGLRPG